mgnify:CR=1 FL=1
MTETLVQWFVTHLGGKAAALMCQAPFLIEV